MKVKPSAEAVFALTSSNTGDNGTFKNVTGGEEHVDAGYGKADDIVKDKGILANQRLYQKNRKCSHYMTLSQESTVFLTSIILRNISLLWTHISKRTRQ